MDLWRKLFGHPYHWPWLNVFEDCLAQLLSEGYQIHVCSAALYSVVLAISGRNYGSGCLTAEDPQSQIFSLCIPAVMDLIQQDIFGSASEIKEVEGVKKRSIKKSSGGKRFNTLEMVAGILLIDTSLALSATDEPNKCQRLLLFLEANQLIAIKMRKNLITVKLRRSPT